MTDNGKEIRRLDLIKFLRLRLGHTRATHGNFYNTNFNPLCNCDINFPTTPKHYLCECPLLNITRNDTFNNSNPLNPLSNPNKENIILLTKFLKRSKLYNEL